MSLELQTAFKAILAITLMSEAAFGPFLSSPRCKNCHYGSAKMKGRGISLPFLDRATNHLTQVIILESSLYTIHRPSHRPENFVHSLFNANYGLSAK